MQFYTKIKYSNREEKAKYVCLKYESILKGVVLDIGADRCYVREQLPKKVKYVSAGLEHFHNIKIDLERKIPVKSNLYDCVLCLDVLEHIEKIHQLFDELCRVTRKYVIISLPNPAGSFCSALKRGTYAENQLMKFYGLPIDVPSDRHRWFFNASEAKRFVEVKAKKNNMTIIQLDFIEDNTIKKILVRFLLSLIIHKSISANDFLKGTLWVVLEKRY